MNSLARARLLGGAALTLAGLLPALPAAASCGSAFCSINTNWGVQSAPSDSGTTLDLRTEYIKQDQPRTGTSDIGIGAIRRHHDEVKTVNRNVIATVDHAFSESWGVTAQLPLVDRDHTHIHNHHGVALLETWDFAKLGDARVTGRYAFAQGGPLEGFGLTFGVKLPTGAFHVRNGAGAEAERSLQPGTGTTDALLGAYVHQPLPELNSSWFAQVSAQRALRERESYRPGSQLGVDVGWQYDVGERVSLLLQVNTLFRGRDSGTQAEPEDSGRTTVALSPGVSVAVTDAISLYGFVQKPIYQHVNGVQLTAKWSAVAGLRGRF